MLDKGRERRLSTAVSRAWRRSEGWLNTFLQAKNRVTRERAKWKLQHYVHEPPNWQTADRMVADEWHAFMHWHDIVCESAFTMSSVSHTHGEQQ